MINWIQNWFNDQCDGEWEHTHVIKIQSLDNPGWNIEIDFNNTKVNIDDLDWRLYEISETDWVGFSIINNIFSASGDSLKLDLMFKIFKLLAEKNTLDDILIVFPHLARASRS
jgi:hypothetical protein